MKITVKLVLDQAFPEKQGVWEDNDFTQVLKVSLPNRDLDEIDNLDLFDNLEELNLSNNKIKVMENLEYLMNLKMIDLSENMIGEEGLFGGRLPSGVEELRLSGNPCVSSPSALKRLQELYPLLRVVVNNENERIRKEESEDNPDPASLCVSSMEKFMNSEDVLREVVDRKCRLQAIVNVNIEAAIEELEKEYDDVTLSSRNRKNNQNFNVSDPDLVDITTEHVPLFQSRLGELKASYSAEKDQSSGDKFFRNLRSKSLQAYEEKIREGATSDINTTSNEKEG